MKISSQGLKGRTGSWPMLAFLDFSIEVQRLAPSLMVPPSNRHEILKTPGFCSKPLLHLVSLPNLLILWQSTLPTDLAQIGQVREVSLMQRELNRTEKTARPGAECSQAFVSQSQASVKVQDRRDRGLPSSLIMKSFTRQKPLVNKSGHGNNVQHLE